MSVTVRCEWVWRCVVCKDWSDGYLTHEGAYEAAREHEAECPGSAA